MEECFFSPLLFWLFLFGTVSGWRSWVRNKKAKRQTAILSDWNVDSMFWGNSCTWKLTSRFRINVKPLLGKLIGFKVLVPLGTWTEFVWGVTGLWLWPAFTRVLNKVVQSYTSPWDRKHPGLMFWFKNHTNSKSCQSTLHYLQHLP